ncbi:uncharacterized protein Dwil_GK27531 [Drosophila willistoni]|uniref:Peptidase S1 domain-containing protein n=1 Tax=Drosophila willistoni TaxID=7260 RepID=A0A0Q9WQM8_DROWI|nr:uncharacterized protein Dwil_GK27531 [Drosophila willistoni]
MKSILFCFLGSLIFLPALEGHSKSLGRIVNGQEAKEGQFPYIVELTVHSLYRPSSLCGGSIIANDWILTAAHCTDGANRVTIHYGSIQKAEGQVINDVEASSIIQHPKYDRTDLTNDIALIHSKWVDFNDRIQKIALPRPEQFGESFEGQWSQAAGWGSILDYKAAVIPKRLHWTNLHIINNLKCNLVFPNITENHLCASSTNRQSICRGDPVDLLFLIRKIYS